MFVWEIKSDVKLSKGPLRTAYTLDSEARPGTYKDETRVGKDTPGHPRRFICTTNTEDLSNAGRLAESEHGILC